MGRTFTNDSGILTKRDPDSVRGADVTYYSYGRVPKSESPIGYPNAVPEIVFEVVSPSNTRRQITVKTGEYLNADVNVVCVVDPPRETAVEIHDKVLEYIHAGTALVWLIYSRSREVVVQTPDGVSRTFRENDVLQDEKVLPGFRCAVAELFR